MLLAIDVGNTNCVIGVYAGDKLVHHVRISTDRSRTDDEYGLLLGGLLGEAGLTWDGMTAAALASVVPPLTEVWRRVCEKRMRGVSPLVVGPGVKTGVPVLYENPREVGADRIVNAVAGYERYRGAKDGPYGIIIVDFGTATTFDVVSVKGEYVGGAIAPGIVISTEALFMRASKLPRVDLEMPASCIGKTTVTSMQAGILYGYVGLVDGLVNRMRGELPFVPKVIATGGLATVIAKHSTTIEEVDENLTLEGLRIIHGRNR
ncbi:MAG: type III pantothenate kinase [Clostridia bacterium]|nr:type III pantothenate kinase [Deltaproteobacteria bacterium]